MTSSGHSDGGLATDSGVVAAHGENDWAIGSCEQRSSSETNIVYVQFGKLPLHVFQLLSSMTIVMKSHHILFNCGPSNPGLPFTSGRHCVMPPYMTRLLGFVCLAILLTFIMRNYDGIEEHECCVPCHLTKNS